MQQAWSVFPPAFLDRLTILYGDRAPELLKALTHPRPTTFRINYLKVDRPTLEYELHQQGVVAQALEWLPGAYLLISPSLRQLSELPVYGDGHLYVQGLSSQLPPLVLDPQPGERVLDIAAAPGSKTTQMAALMQNQGEIVANDTSLVRLYKLQANLETQGVSIVKTRRGQGQDLWRHYPLAFDRALVDVPCSMEGRFLSTKPKTWEHWSPKKIKELSMRQRALLRSAVSAVRPGGVVVYSTCTLAPEENELVVEWLLKKEEGRVVVESIQTDLISAEAPVFDPAIRQWKHHLMRPEIAHSRRIGSSEQWEGFYVARLRKVEY